MRLAAIALSLSLAATLHPQDDVESRLALLMRVHDKMRKSSARVPNYTCTENITRRVLSGNPPRLEYLDRLRLAVAVIRGKEMFSWIGAARFDTDDPVEIVGDGPISTGDFDSFAYTVFVSDTPTYDYGREDIRDGRPVVRYEYRVAVEKSGYTVRSAERHAIVGYHGAFWVDQANEEVLALEVHADEIPEELSGGSLTSQKWISSRDLVIARAQGWRNPAVFTLREKLTRIPAGFRMKWETVGEPTNRPRRPSE